MRLPFAPALLGSLIAMLLAPECVHELAPRAPAPVEQGEALVDINNYDRCAGQWIHCGYGCVATCICDNPWGTNCQLTCVCRR